MAIAKVSELPEAAQDEIGRQLLEHLESLAELRAELQIGIDELDAGLGRPLDIDDIKRRGRERLAN